MRRTMVVCSLLAAGSFAFVGCSKSSSQPEAAPAAQPQKEAQVVPTDHAMHQDGHVHPTAQAEQKAPKSFDAPPSAGTRATCPITGEEFTVVEGSLRSEHAGKHYVFCCGGCKPKFDGNPTQYVN